MFVYPVHTEQLKSSAVLEELIVIQCLLDSILIHYITLAYL